MWTDSHCHLDFPQYADDLQEVIQRAAEHGVHRIIIPSVELSSVEHAKAIAERFPGVYYAAGVHPLHGDGLPHDWLAVLEQQITEGPKGGRLVALGEIGLDYFREADQSARELQMEQCRDQLALAIRYDLPVIIHSRECFDDLYALIHQMDCGSRCVIHCFTGTVEQAFAWLEIGAKLSFTGIITYKRNDALREVVRQLPEGSFWLETDGPYLAPEGFRGQRSEPWQVTHCAAMVSDIRGVSLELLSDQTEQAVGSFFRLE